MFATTPYERGKAIYSWQMESRNYWNTETALVDGSQSGFGCIVDSVKERSRLVQIDFLKLCLNDSLVDKGQNKRTNLRVYPQLMTSFVRFSVRCIVKHNL